jgi:hypothetical protein
MEDKLTKYFENARLEGVNENEMVTRLYGETSGKGLMPEYLIARCHGLNIAQAELATLISQEIKQRGLESLMLRLEASREKSKPSHFHKKRNRKGKNDEPELKKKNKL